MPSQDPYVSATNSALLLYVMWGKLDLTARQIHLTIRENTVVKRQPTIPGRWTDSVPRSCTMSLKVMMERCEEKKELVVSLAVTNHLTIPHRGLSQMSNLGRISHKAMFSERARQRKRMENETPRGEEMIGLPRVACSANTALYQLDVTATGRVTSTCTSTCIKLTWQVSTLVWKSDIQVNIIWYVWFGFSAVHGDTCMYVIIACMYCLQIIASITWEDCILEFSAPLLEQSTLIDHCLRTFSENSAFYIGFQSLLYLFIAWPGSIKILYRSIT